MSTIIENTQEQLNALAEYLIEEREAILEAWRDHVDRDPMLQTASRLDRREFIDHIPIVIEFLCSQLRSWPNEVARKPHKEGTEAVVSHSQHRWQQGYDLRDLVREWGYLNVCLVQVFDRYENQYSQPHSDTLPVARRTLAELINDSIAQSVVEFYRLLQSEAASRMRELEVALAHFREMEKVRGELLRTAVHDLKSSVGVVSGTATLLSDAGINDEDHATIRNLLTSSTSSLEQMLLELMDMARLEAGQEQPNITRFDASRLLNEICQASRPAADERGLYLNVTGPDDLTVQGDAIKVRRVAQNLLNNAIKYTAQGGVTVLWQDCENGRWMFSVQDTGPGLEHSIIAPLARELQDATRTAYELEGQEIATSTIESLEVHSQIDSNFRSAGPGEGIGLSIVKRICDLLDATLELESQAGVGTTFRVVFPHSYTKR